LKPASAKRYLRPLIKYRQSKTAREYLEQRYKIVGECYEFSGPLDKDGYGQVQYSTVGRELGVSRAHQMSYVDSFGPIPQGMFVCHHCDNPSCIRPEHLFLGTPLQNNQDMIRKNRRIIPNKRNKNYLKILEEYEKMPCTEVSLKYNISYSRVCQIWRENGKRDKRRVKKTERKNPTTDALQGCS
jgi:hypothetical protein